MSFRVWVYLYSCFMYTQWWAPCIFRNMKSLDCCNFQMARGSIVFSCGFFSSSSSPFCFLSSYIFFNFLFCFKEKKNTHTYLQGRRRKKMAFTKLFVTIQKQRPRVKRKRRKKNVRNRLLSRLSFVRGGETLLVCCMCTAVPSSSSGWMYLFSFNPLFKKYLFLFVLFETCPPFNFPAGVFFLTFNIHRWLHSAKKP